jgi:hypothetical protein
LLDFIKARRAAIVIGEDDPKDENGQSEISVDLMVTKANPGYAASARGKYQKED